MRITNTMLNKTSAEAGMPLNKSTLLDYVDTDSSDESLLQALRKGKEEKSTEKKSGYEKLEKTAEELSGLAELLAGDGKKSVFDEARESGSTKDIISRAQELVSSYNNTLKELGKDFSELNEYYKKMLKDAAGGSSEALEAIGITQAADGTLHIDKEKLKAADVDALERALGKAGGFSSRLSFVSGRVAENAQAGAESLSSRYDASGNVWSMSSGKYDFRG